MFCYMFLLFYFHDANGFIELFFNCLTFKRAKNGVTRIRNRTDF